MKSQRGVSLSGLMVFAVIAIIAAMIGMKVAPAFLEYNQILKAAKAVAQDSSLRGAGVSEVRKAFGKYQEIDNFKKVTPADIDVTKEGGELVVSFAYQDKIRLFANVSLLLDFEGSSAK